MQVKKYFEKKVSLLSTSDVRYDGELYTVDPTEQSIALKHVNCMGTEGRRSGDQAIAPSDCTYEFIIFRAVNIRELHLDLGNGRRRDLTDEILIPLRSGQSSNYPPKPRQQDMEFQEAPKRKVGYQSRSSQQAQQQYYDQGGYGGGGYGGGYPRRREHYPPMPRHQRYPQYQQDPYYDQGGYYQAQRGYQRQRAPQYYNAPSYYNQGGYGGYNNGGYYRQQQRPMRQQQRGYNNRYRSQQRSGYGQQRSYNQRRNQSSNKGQAGTGAYLDNGRLRGDEIDIKDQQDFDFGAAKNEFDLNDADKNAAHGLIVGNIEKGGDEEVEDEETKQAASGGKDESKKYDSSKSFFDCLETETKKSKPRQDISTQREVDASTFGSVAASYKSRHIQQGYRNRQGNYNRNRYNNQQQQGGQGYNKRRQQQQSSSSQSNGYSRGGDRWVKRG